MNALKWECRPLRQWAYFALVGGTVALGLLITGACGRASQAAPPAEAGDGSETKVVYVDAHEKKYPEGGIILQIDADRLRADLQKAVGDLHSEGYQVAHVIPLLRGGYKSGTLFVDGLGQPASESTFGLGFSRTDGVFLIAEKR